MWGFLFDFRGRASRADIWKFTIACIVLVIFLDPIFSALKDTIGLATGAAPIGGLVVIALRLLISVIVTIAGLVIFTRRLHDRGKSAWWLLVFWFAPRLVSLFVKTPWWLAAFWAMPKFGRVFIKSESLINPDSWLGFALFWIMVGLTFWASLELYCFPGSIGKNKYGPDSLPRPVINPFAGEQAT
jgi:uncharacterized membrane protein YhaH (DUF805 family)